MRTILSPSFPVGKLPTLLAFTSGHRYTGAAGIDVPVGLRAGAHSVELIAKLDTGAACCIFERKYAELLGLDVESGRLQQFRTVTGSFIAFEHEIALLTLGIEFSAIGTVDHDRALFLGAYDS